MRPRPGREAGHGEGRETRPHAPLPGGAVHTKGIGARGYFQVQRSMWEYTKASLFQFPGRQIPVTARFSPAIGGEGTPDSRRNVWGFSTKFHTGSHPFDLLCNHIPVSAVREAARFRDLIDALLPLTENSPAGPGKFWDFFAAAPEAAHFVTWLYSDAGTVGSLRHIRASSVNAYIWENEENIRRYVKYHWIPMDGERYIERREAVRLAVEDPDAAGRDLHGAISEGVPVEFGLHVQLMDLQDAERLPYDPLDPTKIWDEEQYPPALVGCLVLNQSLGGGRAEQVEKADFSVLNLPEGIELPDGGRFQPGLLACREAEYAHPGSGSAEGPGDGPDAGRLPGGVQAAPDSSGADDFAQAGRRYEALSAQEREHLIDNIASELVLAAAQTRDTVLRHFKAVSAEFAEGVERRMAVYESRQLPAADRSELPAGGEYRERT